MAFVLDASAALPWCFLDEAGDKSVALEFRVARGEEVVVPAHWPVEIVSAALRGKRRGRVDDAGVRLFLDNLAAYSIRVAPPSPLRELHALKLLAERLELNPYDASYLNLAQRLALPIATEDVALARAAAAEGILLL